MDNLEVVDVKMDAADDRSVSEDRAYWISVNDQKHKVEKPVVTREEIARIAKVDPKEVCVRVSIHGEKPQVLLPGEEVDLRLPGIEHFLVDEKCIIKVEINNKPIQLAVPTTGEGVKRAAIEAGVNIELDFVLFLEFTDGQADQIDDNEVVFPDEGTHFSAVAPDDNS